MIEANRSWYQVKTCDTNEINEFFAAGLGAEVASIARNPAACLKGARAASQGVVAMAVHIDTAVTVRFQPSAKSFLFYVVTQGSAIWRGDEQVVELSSCQIGVTQPGSTAIMKGNTSAYGMLFLIDRDVFARLLNRDFQLITKNDLQFIHPLSSSTSGNGALINLGWSIILAAQALGPDAGFFNKLTDAVASYLLESLPHNYSQNIAALEESAVPKYLLRARDLIGQELATAPPISEIAAQVGISTRALQYGFLKYFGTTPVKYQQRSRLNKASEEIRTAPKNVSTRQIAARWGFSNFGRFSKLFVDIYGIRPSELRRRSRPTLPPVGVETDEAS